MRYKALAFFVESSDAFAKPSRILPAKFWQDFFETKPTKKTILSDSFGVQHLKKLIGGIAPKLGNENG